MIEKNKTVSNYLNSKQLQNILNIIYVPNKINYIIKYL